MFEIVMGIDDFLIPLVKYCTRFRNDMNIISSISVTDIFFDVYLGKWNYRAIPKVKTWSYFLTIPKEVRGIKEKMLRKW